MCRMKTFNLSSNQQRWVWGALAALDAKCVAAGIVGMGSAAGLVQRIHHPSVQPFALALTVFFSSLVQLQSHAKEVAQYLSAVRRLCVHFFVCASVRVRVRVCVRVCLPAPGR